MLTLESCESRFRQGLMADGTLERGNDKRMSLLPEVFIY